MKEQDTAPETAPEGKPYWIGRLVLSIVACGGVFVVAWYFFGRNMGH